MTLKACGEGQGDGASPLLRVEDLVTAFDTEKGTVHAVDGASFSLGRCRTLGIVGESGCGKSVTALSLMGLLPRPSGRIARGRILFDGMDLAILAPARMQALRSRRMAMIFQEPMTALNPVHRVGAQINEVHELHFPDMSADQRRRAALELLAQVGIADPALVVRAYPHQLSGGMRQRVMIAMALASAPEILIADEPTTALDVTVQAQILELIRSLQAKNRMSVVLITHDLGIIAENCDDAVVMYGGRVVERAGITDLFRHPVHPYTQGLLSAMPRLSHPSQSVLPTIPGRVPSLWEMPQGCRFSNRCPHVMPQCQIQAPAEAATSREAHFAACYLLQNTNGQKTGFSAPLPPEQAENHRGRKNRCRLSRADARTRENTDPSLSPESPVLETHGASPDENRPLVQVRSLKKYFPVRGGIFLKQTGQVHAVDGVSLSIHRGETLGLVGESGCGKTTLGRCLTGLYPPTSGEIFFQGQDIAHQGRRDLKALRLKMQMIFQDPYESLNARHTVGEILREKFVIHHCHTSETAEEIAGLLERVGLSGNDVERFPHEFSGGQRQRIGIARAIALAPELVICDEPVSALDVSVQSQILNLLVALQQEMGLTCLFISHDLAVVKHVSDRIAVMYLGRIVEMARAGAIYERPLHPYTRALLSAVPMPTPRARHQRILLKGEILHRSGHRPVAGFIPGVPMSWASVANMSRCLQRLPMPQTVTRWLVIFFRPDGKGICFICIQGQFFHAERNPVWKSAALGDF